MVAPVRTWLDGIEGRWLGTTAFYLLALVVLPLVTVGGSATLSRRWGRLPGTWLSVATRYSFTLAPLGFGMWLAHYSFHFLTSYDTAVPTAQRFAIDRGWTLLGEPVWLGSCCRVAAGWLLRLEVLVLEVGMLLSLYIGWRLSLARCPGLRQALKALLPWAVLVVLLFAAGVWIVFQPMQMRGTLLEG
jgi:hypothetical protein